MNDSFFNLPHRPASLDRRRTGHTTNRLSPRLRGVAQVRVCLSEWLTFHDVILVDQEQVLQRSTEQYYFCTAGCKQLASGIQSAMCKAYFDVFLTN